MRIYPKAFYPSREQRRKAVRFAKEVLGLIEIKKLSATTGCYLAISPREAKNSGKFSLKNLLKKEAKVDINCKVCAIGALYLGKIAVENNVDIRIDGFAVDHNTLEAEDVRKTLGVFNSELIESAFECASGFVWSNRFGEDNKQKIQQMAVAAMDEYCSCGFSGISAEQRLIAICENIIKNKGIFVPKNYKLEVPVKN